MATAATGWKCTHTASVVSQTATTATIKVTCYWQNDGWTYNINYVSAWVYGGSQSYQVKNNGWVNNKSSNTAALALGSYTFTVNKTTATQYISCYAKITSASSYSPGTKQSTAAGVSVSAKTSYTVAYNANGGSSAPASQKKWHGTTLTLSSTKPTRTGHSFQGWATSASGSVVYSAGGSYTANAAATLYAVWKADTYAVIYNANGGTGAPSSQTKTYGKALTLSTVKPTRENYNFIGWATSASGSVVYSAGGSYTANAAVTLYAVWELAYIKPRITRLVASRAKENAEISEDGTYAIVEFLWSCDVVVSSIIIEWKLASSTEYATEDKKTIAASGTSGNISTIVGNGKFDVDSTYEINVIVADSLGYFSTSTTLNGYKHTIDGKAGGDGVSFGKPAELGAEESLGGNGVADFAFDAKFNEPVYGKALGMDKLPEIPIHSDFNNYMEPGCYAVYSNAIAETCANIPVARAGRLEVWSATGEGVRLEQWSYLRQRFIPYNMENPVWERELTRGEDNVWHYYEWWKSSLTPNASEKVYSKAAITITLTANSVLGIVNTYTKIPFNKSVLSTNDRLTLSSNTIRIGSNIQYIKVSGQVLVSPGSTNALRHVRIQKVSGGSTTSVAWSTLYFESSQHLLHAFTPIIVSVKEGDLLQMVFYTGNENDSISSGSSANGWQTYLTVEEI